MASRAKKLKKTNGYAYQPPRKKDKTLPQETVAKVREFYLSDDMSRVQPGLNDYESVSQK